MKKITIIITSIFILTGIIFYSCTKDGSNLNNVSNHNSPGKINKSLDLANYDSIGINHNLGLDFIFNTSSFPDTSIFLCDLMKYFGYNTLDSSLYHNFNAPFEEGSNEDIFNLLYNTGRITNINVKNYLITMFNLFSNEAILTEAGKDVCFDSIYNIESCIILRDDFSNKEKFLLTGTSSILRHSFLYWSDNSNQTKWDPYFPQNKMRVGLFSNIVLSDAYGYWSAYSFYWTCYGNEGNQNDAIKFATTASANISLQVACGATSPYGFTSYK